MKNKLSISLCVVAAVLMAACSKNSGTEAGTTKQVTIDTTVSPGSLFSLALGSYGKKAVITKQAEQYTVSTVANAGSSQVYRFSPAAKTAVAQQVTLAVTDSSHCNRSHDSTLVTLRLNIQ